MKIRFYPSLAAALACGLLFAGCGGGSSSSTASAGLVPQGQYGSDAPLEELTVTSEGATYAFESGAVGVIPNPIMVSGSGHFDVTGTYALEGPPPPPDGSVPTYAARYTGTVRGNSMTITVTVSASPSYTLGPITLTYGKVVTVPKPT